MPVHSSIATKKDDLAFYTAWKQEHMPVSNQDLRAVDNDTSHAPKPIRKPFDIDRHIWLLTRDVEELDDLVKRMQDGVRRLSTQRVKERLGEEFGRVKEENQSISLAQNQLVICSFREQTLATAAKIISSRN